MALRTIQLTVPDPDQPLSELTAAEMLSSFADLAAAVSRLDTRRRVIFAVIQGIKRKQEAKQLVERLSPEQIAALKAELKIV